MLTDQPHETTDHVPAFLANLDSLPRITLDRAAGMADQAVATGRARCGIGGAFLPGSDLRAKLDQAGVQNLAQLNERDARALDAWLNRPVLEA